MSDRDGPFWIMELLSLGPPQADVALVVRHAEREAIPPGTFGNDVPLTNRGVGEAEELGARLSNLRPQISATSSPVPRCLSTASAILRVGDRPDGVALDWRLGDPGPFVVDAAGKRVPLPGDWDTGDYQASALALGSLLRACDRLRRAWICCWV